MEQYDTIRIRFDGPICMLQINRPEANNTINDLLIAEFQDVLRRYRDTITVLVIEGLPEVFCFGADFQAIERSLAGGEAKGQDPEPLYNVWLDLATGPYVSVAHVRGKANAGGMGFVAACDIVLANETAIFSLSELLFGLMPACVLPFLNRRIGFQKAHYLTLMTQPISVQKAEAWGLVDAYDANSENLLRKHLLRLRRLSKKGITRYKRYMGDLDGSLAQARPQALAANLEVFTDMDNLDKIARYVTTGVFPWEE
ncbi:enoyl-CoA hydratase/isomerase [Leptothoe sp. ISB3NOV94-8A]|uniref:Enoyl-CoA hydratase/isomerase n=2 Tax=Cyanobacteriota TaxID=1117 RepID=A0A6M0RQ47_9CYAN|nr:enoyl-CoA hydratase/isomerase [Adonisia turfae]AMH40438.1 enoyl-CoA hydratase [Leptolyngbya sp. ISBN3-Nov-94-8]MDV3348446.1 enoyl-CoA hydratase/isomerase [Leptothoe sp. LEGE 181152]NEZ57811.1 enoyl-CoA hydratase/isomerase [Adonisia turfae CCMR0081]